MIRLCVMLLINKNVTNPINVVANASASSTTSDTTKVATSTLALKRIQEPENRDDLAK